MARPIQPLRVIAQPKASYRERYFCEVDPTRHRAVRFLRADTNQHDLNYPTVEIPTQWCSERLYIRVTLVTVTTAEAPVVCVHPYPIDTQESNVIKDRPRNTLYFPISAEELRRRQKSFRIVPRKLTQHELKNYGLFYLLNSDEQDIERTKDPHDARQLIDIYRLGTSQLIFSVAELVDENVLPVIYEASSTYSNPMTAITATTTDPDGATVQCAPRRSSWLGGDEILMCIPQLDRRRICQVYLELPLPNKNIPIPIEFVDTKTIKFIIPSCPIQTVENQTILIPIVVFQRGEKIAYVNFQYESLNKCPHCNANLTFDSSNESGNDERILALNAQFNANDIAAFHHDPGATINDTLPLDPIL